MNAEKVSLLVCACITYGHLGYLNLDDQQLICLYDECLVISQHLGDPFICMLCMIQLRMLLDELQESNGFENFSQYLSKMLEVSKQNRYEEMTELAFVLMAKRYVKQQKFDKATECCEKVINNSKNVVPGLSFSEEYEILNAMYEKNEQQRLVMINGSAYEILLQVYESQGKYDEMKERSENCIKFGKEISNNELECIGYFHLGSAYNGLNKWNEAISSSQECIKIASQVYNDDKLKKAIAEASLNIGIAYRNLGILEKAQCYLESSLKARKELLVLCNKSRDVRCYMELGHVHDTSRNYQEAINICQEGLKISFDLNDKHDEGILHRNLGKVYFKQGEYYKSLQCFEKGLQAFKDIKNRKLEGSIYSDFAGVYSNTGNYETSLEYLEKSLAIAIETRNKQLQVNCYGNLGIAYKNLKEYKKAEGYHIKCLGYAIVTGDKNAEGMTYSNIGVLRLQLGIPKEAIKFFEKSLNIAKSNNYKEEEEEAYSYYYLGKSFFQMKKHDEAIENLETSLEIGKRTVSKMIEAGANNRLGFVYYSQSVIFHEEGDEEMCQNARKKSEEKLKDALQCWEWEFSQLKDLHDLKTDIVDRFIETYKLLTKVLVELQKPEESLLVSDRGRARSLGDILVSRYGITVQREPSQVPLDSTDLERVLSSNTFCILFFAMVDGHLYAWVLAHQKQEVFVTNNCQAFALLKGFFEFYLMKEMQTIRCENRSFESAKDSKLPRDGSKVQTKGSFLELAGRNVGPVKQPQTNLTSEQTTDQLEVWFSLLITPVMQHLQQEEIVIIPDGPLYDVPFAALKDPTTGKYLSETKSIRFSPSLTTLRALQECNVDHHSKTGALIVGDPDVGEVFFKKEAKTFEPLPSAEQEAIVVGKLLDVTPLIGSQATKEMVKKKLREGVAVIHIAAHGDSEHGHIALAPPPRTHATGIPEEQDYMLTMQEVQEIGVTAQLVVLSCCHSGRGDIKAEGVVGMSRAFLAAGARAVVASLWAIDDEATLDFMKSFYACLKMGKSASKSLQIAMDDIRGEEGYEDPKYWAPFFLIGDDVTISL